MLKQKIKNLKYYSDIVNSIESSNEIYKIDYIEYFIDTVILDDEYWGYKNFDVKKAILLFFDILNNNKCNSKEEYVNLFFRYKDKNIPFKERLDIKYGKGHSKEYTKRLKNRPQPEVKTSIYNYKYWMKTGLSEVDAKLKVSEIQSQNSIKRHNKTSKEDYKRQSPYAVEYWLALGYNEDDALLQRTIFLENNHCFKKEFYYKKYGEKEGHNKFRKRYKKREATMIERYGSIIISSGAKSKISIKFFDILTEELLKIGISKDRMIGGSLTEKEFVRTDFDRMRSYFYDFVILDLNLIIEFNGLFWHARLEEEWGNNNFKSFEESKRYDLEKRQFIEDKGYKVLYVWEDENFEEKIKEIVEYARLYI